MSEEFENIIGNCDQEVPMMEIIYKTSGQQEEPAMADLKVLIRESRGETETESEQ